MKQELFSANLVSLNARNQLLTYINGGLALLLAISIYVNLSTHDRLVFVPQGLPANTTVSWDTADPVYMNLTATGFAQLIGSIDPKNINFVVDALSKVLEPRLYVDVRKKLLSKSKSQAFINSGSTTSFTPTLSPIFEADPTGKGGKSFVFGDQATSNFYSKMEKQAWVYEISLRILDGKPVITAIDSYPGVEAHTADWKLKHPDYKRPEAD
jgi:hypothetical protein